MFCTGDYIIYSRHGVCRIEDIRPVELPGIPKERLYYVLLPVDTRANTIFIPVADERRQLRPIISEKEAKALIRDIKQISTADSIPDDWEKEICDCCCRDLVKVIKSIREKERRREREGKKLPMGDKRCLKQAVRYLLDELATALQLEKTEVEKLLDIENG
ncbi:MAG: CarD family transcriptional regulator [Lachnospiraceae bacterium]